MRTLIDSQQVHVLYLPAFVLILFFHKEVWRSGWHTSRVAYLQHDAGHMHGVTRIALCPSYTLSTYLDTYNLSSMYYRIVRIGKGVESLGTIPHCMRIPLAKN